MPLTGWSLDPTTLAIAWSSTPLLYVAAYDVYRYVEPGFAAFAVGTRARRPVPVTLAEADAWMLRGELPEHVRARRGTA